MFKYLIVQLDDTSTSFCHYTNTCNEKRLIEPDVLEKAVLWAMKENLTIQYLYPDYKLPDEYREIINRTYHADIVSNKCIATDLVKNADVVVFDNWEELSKYNFLEKQAYVIRTTLKALLDNENTLSAILPKLNRLNVTITDIAGFSRENDYKVLLEKLVDVVAEEYKKGHNIQLNILTDRILLDSMNNCNAGVESITLAPDGKFYVCTAFYCDNRDRFSIGDVDSGLDIKNQQLYRLDHAPICRNCDAWQCRRCVWMNRKLTLEVNTPGREQCVMAHLERNASRELLNNLAQSGLYISEKEIPAINYLDPFEDLIKKQ